MAREGQLSSRNQLGHERKRQSRGAVSNEMPATTTTRWSIRGRVVGGNSKGTFCDDVLTGAAAEMRSDDGGCDNRAMCGVNV